MRQGGVHCLDYAIYSLPGENPALSKKKYNGPQTPATHPPYEMLRKLPGKQE